MYTEKEWNEFLARKGRTARLHYSLRKNCLKCNHPIINENGSGYCWRCYGHQFYSYNKVSTGQGRESESHKTLKLKAVQFLEEIGCANIREEVRFGLGSKGNKGVKIDVCGENDNGTIGVECGGCLLKKLYKAQGILDELYILPYGQKKPFRWCIGMSVCPHCGHKL